MNRRGFLTAIGSLIAAPAVVRVTSIMPVRRPPLARTPLFAGEIGRYNGVLMRYRNEIMREYLRQNLFATYSEAVDYSHSFDDYGQRVWMDWARNAMPVVHSDA